MDSLSTDNVTHLGSLARIRLTDEEVTNFKSEIGAILAYVETVSEIAAEAETKVLGSRYNVMREDEVTNKAGEYTEAMLKAAPEREGDYVKVKKILNN